MPLIRALVIGPASHAEAHFSNVVCVLTLVATARYWHCAGWSFNV